MIENLRISVTQNCNLNCDYCHDEGQKKSSEQMSLLDMKNIAIKAKRDGIKKVKITGGEPLLRKDIAKIVKIFSKYFEEVSMVTNGLLLSKHASKLKKAGLNRINIGCDSLYNPKLKNAKKIVGDLFSAKNAGLTPIKINMVVQKGLNDHEIEDMINFAKEKKVILQLIELINVNHKYYKKHFFSLENVENDLKNKAFLLTKNLIHDRSQYHLPGVVVEVVRPGHKGFCENCKRVRITSNGKVKACLFQKENLIDYKEIDSFVKVKGLCEGITNDRHL
ncbi:GTP 3',8-cyclase MoaA [Candidatus Woesearchaeota archaeon]|nr:GTP 3',8-cyclase MoaA [Candidatus Woesearchaeota archaeon]